MSIIIPTIEMPKGCFFCPLVGSDYRCRISHLDVSQHTMRRHDDCPLIELPTEHGDLIDRGMQDDVIMRLNENDWQITRGEYKRFDGILFEFPVVVPAEKGGD